MDSAEDTPSSPLTPTTTLVTTPQRNQSETAKSPIRDDTLSPSDSYTPRPPTGDISRDESHSLPLFATMFPSIARPYPILHPQLMQKTQLANQQTNAPPAPHALGSDHVPAPALLLQQVGGQPSDNRPYDRVLTGQPQPVRPHPHLIKPVFYINSYPSNLPEMTLARAIPDCLPMRINLRPPVPENMRLMPDMHYDWMPKCGTIEFSTLDAAERALAVLANHTSFTPLGVWFSPYPPPASLPLPDGYVTSRYIRPTHLAIPPTLPPNPTPEQSVAAYLPTPNELYAAVRPWGSVRMVNTWVQETVGEGSDMHDAGKLKWLARVDFWFEDEARRFEIGFGATGSLLKGWQVFIYAADPQAMIYPSSIDGGIVPSTGLMPVMENAQYIPPSLTPLPRSPPPLNYTPPWAAHNIFAAGIPPEGYGDASMVPSTPASVLRRLSRSSMGSPAGQGRPRTWSLTVGETPDGEIRPTGLVADDGTVIQHGPGQHIRPAPAFGPGSTSASGLVDYSNVFVKNLDSDINSYYLEEMFSHLGRVVSARVMRDQHGRSRGYGFVSFYTPEQAASAIQVMNGTSVGRQRISVTLHEPRKLRPEKLAERAAQGLPVTPGGRQRRSMSPIRAGDKSSRSKRVPERKPSTPSDTVKTGFVSRDKAHPTAANVTPPKTPITQTSTGKIDGEERSE
ncbi:hypothetical protein CI109_100313 [Kwoniella shandongensis]|uniref:RRM domain-containing protein n=1 Tax=Kwoniella shandongensis TaxID=1734106 RepID=A0AAJ8LDL9_9TREE